MPFLHLSFPFLLPSRFLLFYAPSTILLSFPFLSLPFLSIPFLYADPATTSNGCVQKLTPYWVALTE